jgi:fumarylacetoacetate (FAA) hydrolase
MKLATERTRSPDGRLLIVSRDLATAVPATGIASTLQEALERWEEIEEPLRRLYDDLNAGKVVGGSPFDPTTVAAPLPRAWQWLDGSAFPSHAKLMERAFNMPPIETDLPLMYQGMSHRFLGPRDDVPLPSEADGIDFEGELGIITGEVPMGVQATDAARYIRLAVQINDWSLRTLAPKEMKTGFGWIQAKPACSMAPVAVTLDELGSAWDDHRIKLRLDVFRGDDRFGAVPATEMEYGFHDLVAHAARTRDLCAGTVIGSGTVSVEAYRETGSCCIAERRAIEMVDSGAPKTPFLSFGERVRMAARNEAGEAPFGEIDQQVARR